MKGYRLRPFFFSTKVDGQEVLMYVIISVVTVTTTH